MAKLINSGSLSQFSLYRDNVPPDKVHVYMFFLSIDLDRVLILNTVVVIPYRVVVE